MRLHKGVVVSQHAPPQQPGGHWQERNRHLSYHGKTKHADLHLVPQLHLPDHSNKGTSANKSASGLSTLRHPDVRPARLPMGNIASCLSDDCHDAFSVSLLRVWKAAEESLEIREWRSR